MREHHSSKPRSFRARLVTMAVMPMVMVVVVVMVVIVVMIMAVTMAVERGLLNTSDDT